MAKHVERLLAARLDALGEGDRRAAARRPRRRRLRSRCRTRPGVMAWMRPALASLAGLLIFFGLSEGAVRFFDVPRFSSHAERHLPPHGQRPRFYIENARTTIWEAILGFPLALVLALACATVMAHSRLTEQMALPLVVLIQVTPIVAYAPVVVIWLGFGLQADPLPLVAGVLRAVPGERGDRVARPSIPPPTSCCARSTPTGARSSSGSRVPPLPAVPVRRGPHRRGLALIGAVLGEFFAGSTAGLGHGDHQARNRIRIDQLWGCVFVLALIGVVAIAPHLRVERVILRWHSSQDRSLTLRPQRTRIASTTIPVAIGDGRHLAPRRPAATTTRRRRAPSRPPRPAGHSTTDRRQRVTPGGITDERCDANKAAGKITYQSSFDFSASASILDVVVADANGYFKDSASTWSCGRRFSTRTIRWWPPGRCRCQLGRLLHRDREHQHGRGRLVALIDYGKTAIEALLVRDDDPIRTLADVKGKTIGVKGDLPPSLVAMLAKPAWSAAGLQGGAARGVRPRRPAADPIDALPVYKSNEPGQLDAPGRRTSCSTRSTDEHPRFLRHHLHDARFPGGPPHGRAGLRTGRPGRFPGRHRRPGGRRSTSPWPRSTPPATTTTSPRRARPTGGRRSRRS